MKDNAYCDLTKAIELNPVHVDAIFSRALLARDTGRLDLCVTDLGKCIEYTRMIRLRKSGNDEKKTSMIARDERLLVFLLVRGISNRLLENFQAALDDFELALILEGHNVSGVQDSRLRSI